MVIFRRNIQTPKTPTDVLEIIRSSAYQGTCAIRQHAFSIKCPRRNQRGQMMLVPIKGQLSYSDHATEVILELHAGVEILIGLTVFVVGLMLMALSFLFPAASIAYGVIPTGMGAVISVFYWLRGIEVVDLLEHKITR